MECGSTRLPATPEKGARNDGDLRQSLRCGPDLLRALLVDGDLKDANVLEGVDLHLGTAAGEVAGADGARPASGPPSPVAAIDLLLGCQGPQLAAKATDARPAEEGKAAPPPLFYDNLKEAEPSMRPP